MAIPQCVYRCLREVNGKIILSVPIYPCIQLAQSPLPDYQTHPTIFHLKASLRSSLRTEGVKAVGTLGCRNSKAISCRNSPSSLGRRRERRVGMSHSLRPVNGQKRGGGCDAQHSDQLAEMGGRGTAKLRKAIRVETKLISLRGNSFTR